jgi:hypothetical protein
VALAGGGRLGRGGGAGGASASAPVPRARTVLEAFTLAPHWTLRALAESLGVADPDALRPAVLEVADYVRAGPFARHYILKPENRAPGCPAPDPEAEKYRGGGP